MASRLNTIVLTSKGHHDEGVIGSACYPGEAVEMAADGEYDPLTSALAEALKGGLKIAKEDALQGKTIDDVYVVGETLFWYAPVPGDRIHVRVKTGETILVGDVGVAEGGGSGLFVKAAGTETKYMVEFLEASGGELVAATHLIARVL